MGRGQSGTFWNAGNVLHLDLGGDYTGDVYTDIKLYTEDLYTSLYRMSWFYKSLVPLSPYFLGALYGAQGGRFPLTSHRGLVPSASTYPHGYGCEAPAQPVEDIESQETGHRNEVVSWERRKTSGDGD